MDDSATGSGTAGQGHAGAAAGVAGTGGTTHDGVVSGGSGNPQGGAAGAGTQVAGVGECSAFAACGGSLVGRWKVVKVCATEVESKKLGDEIEFCADSSTVASVTATGFVEFDAQGGLKFDTVTAAHLVESVPTSCVVAQQDCAGVQAAITAKPGTIAAICQATPAGCDCVYDIRAPHRVENSYVASGTRYTETDSGDGQKTISNYCVDGTSLRISDDSAVLELVSSP